MDELTVAPRVEGRGRPKLLDLFCCAGGAGMGYHRAGFDVVGVDIKPQPRYPFPFVQGDALDYLREHGREFDAIHASPPCQHYSALTRNDNRKNHPDLVEPTRSLLKEIGRPFVIENVPGAPLIDAAVLCGTMFGLRTPCGAELRRHRLFETNWLLLTPPCNHRSPRTIGVVGGGYQGGKRTRVINVVGHGGYHSGRPLNKEDRERFSVLDARVAMGMEWTNRDELSQAIPPAYTEFIGRQLMLECAAEAGG